MRRTLNHLLVILVFMIVAAITTVAQGISGQIIDRQTGQPVFNISVWCEGSGYSGRVATDRGGRFRFVQLVPGHYTVSVHTPGYKDVQQSADLLDPRANENMILRLTEDSTSNPNPNAALIPAKAREEFDKGAAIIGEGKKEKLQEGITHLDKAVTLYPNYLQAQLLLGATYMDLQQWDKAEVALKKAMEIDPKAANSMFALGELYRSQKKYDDAEKILLQGLAVEDRSYLGHLSLAQVYWDRGSKLKEEAEWRPLLEKSYEQVKKALELNPELADAHLLKGNLLLKVNRYADAQHEFEEYLRIDPKGQFAEPTRSLVDRIKKGLAGQRP